MVCFGMFLCALIIERSTEEQHYESHSKPRMFWLQRERRVGDQVFDAFAGTDRVSHYIRSSKAKVEESQAFVDFLLWTAVATTMVGFVLQFVGLRGLHSSVAMFQLGGTLLMAVIRSSLRTERGGSQNNMWDKRLRKAVNGFELDWFAMELVGIWSFTIGQMAFGNGNLLSSHPYHVNEDATDLERRSPLIGPATQVLRTRARLARLTGPSTGLSWDFPVRSTAEKLVVAMEDIMNALFADGMKTMNDWRRAKSAYWGVGAHLRHASAHHRESKKRRWYWKGWRPSREWAYYDRVEDNMPRVVNPGSHGEEDMFLGMHREVGTDGAATSWKAELSEVEALLGLMAWNLDLARHRQRSISETPGHWDLEFDRGDGNRVISYRVLGSPQIHDTSGIR